MSRARRLWDDGMVGLQEEGEKKIGDPLVTADARAAPPLPLARAPSPFRPLPPPAREGRCERAMRPGITLDVWGPAAWNTLHVFAHTAPARLDEAEADEWRTFLAQFAARLPCPRCRRHFRDFLARRAGAPLRTRAELVRLLHDAHNEVNVRTGKRPLSLAEHYALYAPRCPSPRGRAPRLAEALALGLLAALLVRAIRATATTAARKKNRTPWG